MDSMTCLNGLMCNDPKCPDHFALVIWPEETFGKLHVFIPAEDDPYYYQIESDSDRQQYI